MTASAIAAYVAFLAHAAIDWDWQVTAVGTVAVLIGVGILAAVEDSGRRTILASRGNRVAGVFLTLGPAGVGF